MDSKRHLAQESKSNSEKSPEEVKKTKSYASLKNWGHDFLKAQGKEGGAEKSNGKSSKQEDTKEEEVEQADDGKTEEADEETEKVGDKRKNASNENGTSKKRQTRQGEGQATEKSEENGNEEAATEENGDEELEDDDEEDDDEEDGDVEETTKGPKKGDTVSWNWGNGQPEGKVLDVKGEKTTIETKRGNEVSRDGKPEDPAVVLDTGKSKAIKSAHELNES
ncbi:DNA-binding protein [Colletotrichum tofieldiae]|nr:DNA-binding protein [Colletotrichum tofieldiae]GKT79746.1 DNA-binding protein [Colletotrichum tofieldiae]GKT84319.1 DNA-binding protein [Colletotrichum tofieldiae]